MGIALAVITLLFSRGAWQAYQMAGLTISSGDIHGLMAKLTEEIQKNGYKTPKSFKNNLTFAGTGFAKLPVTVMAADASVDVTCPADLAVSIEESVPGGERKENGEQATSGDHPRRVDGLLCVSVGVGHHRVAIVKQRRRAN